MMVDCETDNDMVDYETDEMVNDEINKFLSLSPIFCLFLPISIFWSSDMIDKPPYIRQGDEMVSDRNPGLAIMRW